eukprot:COSAG06_NODE_2658_length_6481_cov_157.286901_6_plen_65_part_00
MLQPPALAITRRQPSDTVLLPPPLCPPPSSAASVGSKRLASFCSLSENASFLSAFPMFVPSLSW